MSCEHKAKNLRASAVRKNFSYITIILMIIIIIIIGLQGAKGKGYGTFHEEAVRVFSSLLEQESIADPIPVIQVSLLSLLT